MWIIEPIAVTDSVLASTNVAEADYPEYAAGTTYNSGDRVMVAAEHKNYECLADNTLGVAPGSDLLKWLELGATNAFAMFDSQVGTVTSNTGSIVVSFDIDGLVGAVALQNLSADSVRISMTDAAEGLVYDRTISLIESSSEDWYSYFFGEDTHADSALMMDLPPYLDASVTLTLSGSGTVSCGLCVIGKARRLGHTQYGMNLGITDYSQKTTDTFGNATFIQRGYAARGEFDVRIPSSRVGLIRNLLASYRTTPLVYVATPERPDTAVYGIFKSFNIILANAQNSQCAITIEGMI